MRKIYGIWFMRMVFPVLAAELILLSALVVGVQSYMSFNHIAGNITYRVTHHPISMLWYFSVEALANTELVTKLLLLGAALVGVFIARDAMRLARQFRGNFLRVPRVT